MSMGSSADTSGSAGPSAIGMTLKKVRTARAELHAELKAVLHAVRAKAAKAKAQAKGSTERVSTGGARGRHCMRASTLVSVIAGAGSPLFRRSRGMKSAQDRERVHPTCLTVHFERRDLDLQFRDESARNQTLAVLRLWLELREAGVVVVASTGGGDTKGNVDVTADNTKVQTRRSPHKGKGIGKALRHAKKKGLQNESSEPIVSYEC